MTDQIALLWLEILARHEPVESLNDEDARQYLIAREFPLALIEAYLAQRAL